MVAVAAVLAGRGTRHVELRGGRDHGLLACGPTELPCGSSLDVDVLLDLTPAIRPRACWGVGMTDLLFPDLAPMLPPSGRRPAMTSQGTAPPAAS
jgi:hypothetical protein